MPKMTSNDVVRVHVHNDGDIELQKHELNPCTRMLYPGDILYAIAEVVKGCLDKELSCYGVPEDVAKRCIDEVIRADYHEIIEVK